ncbi:MAG: hypothetical protein IPL65_18025 [Lewinellaceae bacterium]|nr:hypothetical protein [Lewinellaceae bacterium]
MGNQKLNWVILFLLGVLGYMIWYAPYGMNETDGGFLDGLAWQLTQGKHLYQDVIYVRPPIPVWLRWLGQQIIPLPFSVLGERIVFYAMVAGYSWMGAALLMTGAQRWQLALFAFLVSAHNYPATAWHTTDGIFFAVAAIFWAKKRHAWALFASGCLLSLAILCKQSFYPLLLLPFLFWWGRWLTRPVFFVSGMLLAFGLTTLYLFHTDSLAAFFYWTGGSRRQAGPSARYF